MKSFLEYILEETHNAPSGVIFDGNKKAYVGSHHGKSIILSNDLKTKILNLAKEYGIWYEGNGDDIAPNIKLFGNKKAYVGSWDKEFAKTVKGYPIHFIGGIFSNVKENNRVKKLTSPNLSIFDAIIKKQKGNKYFEDRSYNENDLTKFLVAASEDNVDFLKMSQLSATEENMRKFLTTGEKLMWPDNWQEYPNKLGKLAKKAEDERNRFVLKQKQGVFVLGSGHLLELKALDKSLKMIGGEKA
jgi:hypothetical protein